MANAVTIPNDNDAPTRAELEAANRGLKSSLEKCEALVADCREKIAAAQEHDA